MRKYGSMTNSNKIIAIHQPNYLPWLGYFDKIKKSSIFIFMDNAQYTRGSWINRCKIKNSQGWQWLTVPIMTSGKFGQMIAKAKIDYTTDWPSTHLKTIEINYKKSLYFNKFFPLINRILRQKIDNLADLNIELIKKISELLKFKTKFVRGKTLNISGQATNLLINMVKAVEGNTYFYGGGATEYQENDKFKKNSLKLANQNFKHPVYNQLWKNFIPGLSIIDVLMNCGLEETKRLLSL